MSDFQFVSPTSGERNDIITGKDKTALVDADFIKYTTTHRASKDLSIHSEGVERCEELERMTDEVIEQYIEVSEAKNYLFCLSDKTGNLFRSKMAYEKKYKGQRKKDPIYEKMFDDMAIITEYIKASRKTLFLEGYEADDLVSMLQNDKTFIISQDKDMVQVPGYHYNMKEDEFHFIPEIDAICNLMKQMIIGDNSSDNIPGLAGKGPAYLKKLDNLTPKAILQEYEIIHGGRDGLDAFVEMYNLLALKRNRGAYFQETHKPIFEALKNMT